MLLAPRYFKLYFPLQKYMNAVLATIRDPTLSVDEVVDAVEGWLPYFRDIFSWLYDYHDYRAYIDDPVVRDGTEALFEDLLRRPQAVGE